MRPGLSGEHNKERGGDMLEIRNLSKTYPNGVQALKDVSLSIPTGMYGLLGPNGAGKSTLMRTVATLQQPDAGSIELDGLDVLKAPADLRRQLGYLPQDFGVYPRISALDMLDHMAVLKGFSNKKLDLIRKQPQVAAAKLVNEHMVITLREDGDSSPLVNVLVGAGVNISEVHKGTTSLEETFVTLMEEGYD